MTKKTEGGIREYLNSLGQNNKPIVDTEGVKKLKADLKAESDPIAQLRLIAEIEVKEQGEVPDLSGPKAVFINEAKAWAEAESIPASAFVTMGVSEDVLKEAGFAASDLKGAKGAKSKGGARKPRMNVYSDVYPVLCGLDQPFKAKDAAEAIDRNPATTNNYIKTLIEAEKLVEAGEDASGPGRAAKLYKIV